MENNKVYFTQIDKDGNIVAEAFVVETNIGFGFKVEKHREPKKYYADPSLIPFKVEIERSEGFEAFIKELEVKSLRSIIKVYTNFFEEKYINELLELAGNDIWLLRKIVENLNLHIGYKVEVDKKGNLILVKIGDSNE